MTPMHDQQDPLAAATGIIWGAIYGCSFWLLVMTLLWLVFG